MINEKLISTVRYKGQSVGVGVFTIEDTSFYPTYTFDIVNIQTGTVTNPSAFKQLNQYQFNFKQDTRNTELSTIYVTISSPDGKLLSEANEVPSSSIDLELSFNLDAQGAGSAPIDANYFPSILGYSGSISFYHDEARLLLIRSFNITVTPLSNANLEIVSKRSTFNSLSYPSTINMGEDFVVRVSTTDNLGNTGSFEIPYAGDISGEEFQNNQWIQPVTSLVVSGNKSSSPIIGTSELQTVSFPAIKTPQNMGVRMGEIVGFNQLKIKNYIDSFNWFNDSLTKVQPLYRTGGNGFVLAIAQGGSLGDAPRNQLGPVTISNSGTNATFTINSPAKGSSNPEIYNGIYTGEISANAWKPQDLTTAESRIQFGKYQKSFTRYVRTDNISTYGVTWADVSDPIADAAYGVPSSFIGSDVVVLVTPRNRADYNNVLFNTGGPKEFYLRPVSFLSNGTQNGYMGYMDVLVLRKSAMLNTYPDWVPYPRIIKADWAIGDINGNWPISIPAGLGIDLRESRYQVQHTGEMTEQNGGFMANSWTDAQILREELKITIKATFGNGYSDPKHYAIWDFGPDVNFNDPKDGRLRGEIKPTNVSPWVTNDLSGPVDANAASVVVLPTLGDSAQYYQSSIISRDVSGQAKKFSVTARDSAKELYQGEFGLLVWNTLELINTDRRNQFGRYQASMTIPYNSANGVSTITLDQVNNSVATASWGSLTSLKDPNLMMFINTEAYSEWNSTFWGANIIQVGINYGQGPSFVGNVSVLFMRKVGWVHYVTAANKYPRVIYADVVDIGAATSHTLTIDQTYMPDPLDARYQVMAQVKPTTQSEAWIKFHWTKLTRSATSWKIDLSGGGTSNTLQIAIIDYGPPPGEIYGEEYIVSTERIESHISIVYVVASRYPVAVGSNGNRVYGSIRSGWSYFGNYFALFNQVSVSNISGGTGFIALDFTTGNSSVVDTTSNKPATIYLTINNNVKIQMNRETSRGVTDGYQRYYVIPAHYSSMFQVMANLGSPAEKTYLITLT